MAPRWRTRPAAVAALAVVLVAAAVAAVASAAGNGTTDSDISAAPLAVSLAAALTAVGEQLIATGASAVAGAATGAVMAASSDAAAPPLPPLPPPDSDAAELLARANELKRLTQAAMASGEALPDDTVAAWAALRATLLEMGALAAPPPDAVVAAPLTRAQVAADVAQRRRQLEAGDDDADDDTPGVRQQRRAQELAVRGAPGVRAWVNASSLSSSATALSRRRGGATHQQQQRYPLQRVSRARELKKYKWLKAWWRWVALWDKIVCGYIYVEVQVKKYKTTLPLGERARAMGGRGGRWGGQTGAAREAAARTHRHALTTRAPSPSPPSYPRPPAQA